MSNNKSVIKDLLGKTLKQYDQEVVNSRLSAHDAKVVSTSANGHMSASDKVKLNSIANGAEVNQNAFTHIKVGTTTISADQKQDTLSIVAGTNVTITPDSTGDSITISSKDTVYTHPGSGTNPHGTTKSDVGLGNVTNESKATMFTSPAFTGIPTAPTAVAGTATTQIATTEFVKNSISNLSSQGHKHNASEITAMTGYVKQSSVTAISTSDTLNVAIGKLEKALDNKSNVHSHPYKADSWLPTWSEIQGKPSLETPTGAQAKATAALNSAKSYADSKVASLINSAPETLDTLQELANALGNDANFATTITNKIGTKADTTYVNQELAKKANASHNQASNTITAMTGYVKASTISAISSTDNLNTAIGKLEKALDNKSDVHSHPYRSNTWVPTFAEINSKPTTLAGYGITDAAPKQSTETRLTALETSVNYTITDQDVQEIISYIKGQ